MCLINYIFFRLMLQIPVLNYQDKIFIDLLEYYGHQNLRYLFFPSCIYCVISFICTFKAIIASEILFKAWMKTSVKPREDTPERRKVIYKCSTVTSPLALCHLLQILKTMMLHKFTCCCWDNFVPQVVRGSNSTFCALLFISDCVCVLPVCKIRHTMVTFYT